MTPNWAKVSKLMRACRLLVIGAGVLGLVAFAGCRSSLSYYKEGVQNLAQKRYDAAVASFSEAIAEDPGSHLAYLNRADAYLALDKNTDALADYDLAVSLLESNNTPNPWFYNRRGLARYQTGAYQGALQDWKRALVLETDREGAGVKTRKSPSYIAMLETRSEYIADAERQVQLAPGLAATAPATEPVTEPATEPVTEPVTEPTVVVEPITPPDGDTPEEEASLIEARLVHAATVLQQQADEESRAKAETSQPVETPVVATTRQLEEEAALMHARMVHEDARDRAATAAAAPTEEPAVDPSIAAAQLAALEEARLAEEAAAQAADEEAALAAARAAAETTPTPAVAVEPVVETETPAVDEAVAAAAQDQALAGARAAMELAQVQVAEVKAAEQAAADAAAKAFAEAEAKAQAEADAQAQAAAKAQAEAEAQAQAAALAAAQLAAEEAANAAIAKASQQAAAAMKAQIAAAAAKAEAAKAAAAAEASAAAQPDVATERSKRTANLTGVWQRDDDYTFRLVDDGYRVVGQILNTEDFSAYDITLEWKSATSLAGYTVLKENISPCKFETSTSWSVDVVADNRLQVLAEEVGWDANCRETDRTWGEHVLTKQGNN